MIDEICESARAADGSLEVTEIVPNGPVDRSANVKLGDVLLAVDGKDVGQTVASARELLLGPAGTTVRLVLARTEANAVGSAAATCIKPSSKTITILRAERTPAGA